MIDTRRAVRLGLIAGVAVIFVGAIGMVETFNRRLLVDPFIRMGALLFVGILFVVGAVAARGDPNPLQEPEPDNLKYSLTGLVTGLVGGALLIVYLLMVDNLTLTRFFPNMRPSMIDDFTFGAGVPAGLGVTLAATGVAGALGGLVASLPESTRRGLARAGGTVIALALFEMVVDDLLDFADWLADLLYTPTGALRWTAALVVGALAWFLTARMKGRGAGLAGRAQAMEGGSMRTGLIVLAIVVVLILPQLFGGILNELLINVSLFILMGLGLNIVVGYAGLLDLGYVAFFAVGAYGTAVLTSPLSPGFAPQVNWWLALPVVMIMAVVAGILVGTPVIRMRGDYLAIVTLGFGEIVRILLLSDWLTPLFGGAQGIRRIPGIQVPIGGDIGGTDPELFIYFTMFFVAIAAYISYRAQQSRVGRAWAAMREDEDVAEAIGINTVQFKLLAFVTGAVVASFAGALFSAKVGTVFTNSFDVLVSIIILVVVIVGGMGSIPGVMVGAFVLIGILGGPKSPGLLQEFAEFKLLIYGALLIYMMLKRPEGLLPSVRRTRELHGEEMAQDAWLRTEDGLTGEPQKEATV